MSKWDSILDTMSQEDDFLLEEGRLASFAKGALAAGALALGGMAKADIADGGFGYNGYDGYSYRGGANPTQQQYDELKAHRPFSVHKYNQAGSETRDMIRDKGLDKRGRTQYGQYGFTLDDNASDFVASHKGTEGARKIGEIESMVNGDKYAMEDEMLGGGRVEYEPFEVNAKRSGHLSVRVFSSNGNRTAELEETTQGDASEGRSFNLYLPMGCRGATPKEIESNQWLYGGNALNENQIKDMFVTAFTALRATTEEIAPGVEMLVMNTGYDEEVKRNMLELDTEFTKICNAFDLGYEGIKELVRSPRHGNHGDSTVTLGYNQMNDNGEEGHRMFGLQKFGQIGIVMRDPSGAPIPLPKLRATMAHELCHHMRLGHGKDFMYMLKRVIAYCEAQGLELDYDEDDVTPYDSKTLERGEDDPHESAGYKFWEEVLPSVPLFCSIV